MGRDESLEVCKIAMTDMRIETIGTDLKSAVALKEEKILVI